MPAMHRRVFISTVLAAAACIGLLSTASVRAAEKLRVGVSIPAAIAFVPLQVGIDTGIFVKHGLEIEAGLSGRRGARPSGPRSREP